MAFLIYKTIILIDPQRIAVYQTGIQQIFPADKNRISLL